MMYKSFLTSIIAALALAIAVPVNAASAATLDQRVQRLERMMENPVLLQLSRRLGEQQRQIQQLQDENDRLKRSLEKFKNTANERYTETDERLSSLETAPRHNNEKAMIDSKDNVALPTLQTVDGASEKTADMMLPTTQAENKIEVANTQDKAVKEIANKANSSDSLTTKTIKTRPATEEEKEAYKAAFALMRSAKYEASIKAFEKFITTYPESSLASNASYWAGEGYLVKNKADKALAAFKTVLEVYPGSPKVPDATLRAGDSYSNLGDDGKANQMYEKIIADRPLSKAAKNAKKRLAAK